jgi:hypothetical protein
MSQRRSWLRQTADCASRPIKSLLLGAPSLIPDGLIVELHHLILGKRSKTRANAIKEGSTRATAKTRAI